MDADFTVYRGFKIPTNELASIYKVGNSITLKGFTSTTINKKVAIGFAGVELSDNNHPSEMTSVLMEIRIKGVK